jgi:hypothetical protein
MNCRVCASPASPFGTARLLDKHDVQYFRCPACGFVQTEEPDWLGDAYSEAIARTDLGLAARNRGFSVLTRAIIGAFFKSDGRFLDYGGGYGLFARTMRDLGFDFRLYERQCPNLFAGGFGVELASAGRYELVTAFEVFEHLVNPLEEIERMHRLSDSILFSTLLVPTPAPGLADWWYYGLEHGQHVSLYSLEALRQIARRFRLNLYSDGRALHLLTPKKIPRALFKLVSRYRVARALGFLWKRESLLPRDYLELTGRPLN